MGMRAEKRAFLARYLGEERVRRLEETLEAYAKELEGAGVDWKELQDVLTFDELEFRRLVDEHLTIMASIQSSGLPPAEQADAFRRASTDFMERARALGIVPSERSGRSGAKQRDLAGVLALVARLGGDLAAASGEADRIATIATELEGAADDVRRREALDRVLAGLNDVRARLAGGPADPTTVANTLDWLTGDLRALAGKAHAPESPAAPFLRQLLRPPRGPGVRPAGGKAHANPAQPFAEQLLRGEVERS